MPTQIRLGRDSRNDDWGIEVVTLERVVQERATDRGVRIVGEDDLGHVLLPLSAQTERGDRKRRLSVTRHPGPFPDAPDTSRVLPGSS